MVVSKSDLNYLESYVHKLIKVKLNKAVGTTWQYANENYQILGPYHFLIYFIEMSLVFIIIFFTGYRLYNSF